MKFVKNKHSLFSIHKKKKLLLVLWENYKAKTILFEGTITTKKEK